MEGRRVAGEEEPVHREGRPSVHIAPEHARPSQGQAPESFRVGFHNARRVAGQQPQTARELRRDERIGHLTGRLGHAIAGKHARLRSQGLGHRVRVQRAAPEQDALVGPQSRAAVAHHILQHLIHHGNVSRMQLGGVAQHLGRVEALVDAQRPAAAHAAHEYLETTHMEEREHCLP